MPSGITFVCGCSNVFVVQIRLISLHRDMYFHFVNGVCGIISRMLMRIDWRSV